MYANVILDRVCDALDHVFTYAVPEGMDATATLELPNLNITVV